MRQFIVAACLLVTCATPGWAREKPQDCDLNYRSEDRTLAVIDQRKFNKIVFEGLCADLNRNRMGVRIRSEFGTISERKFSWVLVTVYRIDTQVESEVSYQSTTISLDGSKETAEDALMSSVDDAMEAISKDRAHYIASVTAEEARLRSALAQN